MATPTPDADARYWKREIEAAGRRERDYRDEGETIYKIYRGKNRKKNSFNILWANTEILRPSIFNSTPQPDVRRRFRDNDPLGKAVSEVLERSLEVNMDSCPFDEVIEQDVLDALLPGRGVTRIRYTPSMRDEPAPKVTVKSEDAPTPTQSLEYEQVAVEHVDWLDYRQGYGRTWPEVEWVAFRHQLTEGDSEEKFGEEITKQIEFAQIKEDEDKKAKAEDNSTDRKVAEFWEVWDRAKKRVFFLNIAYTKSLLFPVDSPKGEPPLDLEGFFPCVEPLRIVEDPSSQMPTPMYQLYKQQAEELDLISARIDIITKALRVRGVYDATLGELDQLFAAGDNKMIPSSKAAMWIQNGGIEKAIWWMPIDKAAMVLKELYVARDACKNTIYELTGISDILRGATNPNETLGAQEIKANYATVRLKRMQRIVERHVRNLVRLMSEVIGNKFEQATLVSSTGLQYLTKEQKAAKMVEAQMVSAKGQPVPPQLQEQLMKPTWEEIIGVLRSDAMRCYRVDVETDSTIAATMEADMTGLREVIGGITEFWAGVGPAVEAGAVPIEVVKEITMVIARRAKMGLSIEDALDKLQQPKGPTASPEMQAQQKQLQQQQGEIEKAKEAIQAKEQQIASQTLKLEAQSVDLKKREAMLELQEKAAALGDEVESREIAVDDQIRSADDEAKARDLEAQKRDIEHQAKESALAEKESAVGDVGEIKEAVAELKDAMTQAAELLAEIAKRPKLAGLRKVRGPDGSVSQRIPVYDDGSEGSALSVQ